MAIQDYILFHMGAVYRHPFPIHILYLYPLKQDVLGIPQKRPYLVLRVAVLFNIRVFDHSMDFPDQCHHTLVH